MGLSGTRLWTGLGAVEWNLASVRARQALQQVEAGQAPRSLLAWVPLFKGGGRPGIIHDWRRLAEQEPDRERRRALGLAVLFAEAAGCAELWQEALEGWEMIESKIVKEWTAQARQEGVMEGEIRGLRKGLLLLLNSRFGTVPGDLAAAIHACTDLEKLNGWMDQATVTPSLDEFSRLVRG
jgi:hypothetical protein